MEWSLSQNKLLAFHRLMRTDKPIGALLLLWPTLWALWVASPGVPPLWILAVFVAGVWLMRAAGCVVNDYADRKFDGHVKRILDTQGISAHILDSLCNVFPIIQCICITQCIAQRYLCVCFFFVGCLYRCLQVADII